MQAYMKSTMPFLGVRVPEVRRLARHEAGSARPAAADLEATVRALWDAAAVREERYAATALLDTPAARSVRRPELLGLLRHLIATGAWWDHVDELSHRVGDLLVQFPQAVRPEIVRWAGDGDRWLRRASIICQLGLDADTIDLPLLSTVITANLTDRDFFVRKAIGWALRDAARREPDWVRAFVATHDLSPLSRREALKHLQPR